MSDKKIFIVNTSFPYFTAARVGGFETSVDYEYFEKFTRKYSSEEEKVQNCISKNRDKRKVKNINKEKGIYNSFTWYKKYLARKQKEYSARQKAQLLINFVCIVKRNFAPHNVLDLCDTLWDFDKMSYVAEKTKKGTDKKKSLKSIISGNAKKKIAPITSSFEREWLYSQMIFNHHLDEFKTIKEDCFSQIFSSTYNWAKLFCVLKSLDLSHQLENAMESREAFAQIVYKKDLSEILANEVEKENNKKSKPQVVESAGSGEDEIAIVPDKSKVEKKEFVNPYLSKQSAPYQDYTKRVGAIVYHNVFGKGTIISVSGDSMTVAFATGQKKLSCTLCEKFLKFEVV